MEINRKYLDALVKEMDAVEYRDSSHIADMIVVPIEMELSLGNKYTEQIPEEYPDNVEKMLGVRRLHYPADCTYDGKKYRVGATRLHLKPQNAKKNVDSAVMIYMDDVKTLEFGAKAHSSKDAAAVMLHDNGVVSALYACADSPIMVCNSWYYPEMNGFGGLPYPKSEEEVYAEITHALRKINTPKTSEIMRRPSFKTIPKTVMLAVNTYDKVK